MYIEGGTTSGFYSSDEKSYTLRMYRLCGSKKPHLESVSRGIVLVQARGWKQGEDGGGEVGGKFDCVTEV